MAYYKSSNIKIDNSTIRYDANGQLVSSGGTGGGGNASIDDQTASSTTTYSSNKINSLFDDFEEMIEREYGGNVLSYADTLAVLGIPPTPFYQYRLVVPVMTSNTAPSGVVSASSNYPDYEPYKAFRRSNVTGGWMTSSGNTVNAYIQYQFLEPKVIGRIVVYNMADADTDDIACRKFVLQGSNNGTSFSDLVVCEITSSDPGARFAFEVENGTAYQYYRLTVKEVYGDYYVGFGEIDLMEKYVA